MGRIECLWLLEAFVEALTLSVLPELGYGAFGEGLGLDDVMQVEPS